VVILVLIRASAKVSKKHLTFFCKIEEKMLYNNSLAQLPSFPHLKIDPTTCKCAHAYLSANIKVKGCGKEYEQKTMFLMQMYKRERKYKSGSCNLKIVWDFGIPDTKLTSIYYEPRF
jgi:hypothetical protein